MTDKFGLPAIPPAPTTEAAALYNVLVEMRAQLIRHINFLHQKTIPVLITNADVDPAAGIELSKLELITPGTILGADSFGSGVIVEINPAGGIVVVGNLIGIANDAIGNVQLRDSAALSVIGRASNTIGNPGDIVAGVAGQFLTRVGTTLGFFSPVLDILLADIHFNKRSAVGAAAGAVTLTMQDPSFVASTNAAAFVGFLFLDGNKTWIQFEFALPPEFDNSQEITVEVVMLINGASSNSVEMTVHWNSYAESDPELSPSNSGTINQVTNLNGVGAGTYISVLFATGITIGAEKFIRGVLERDAQVANADDDYPDLVGPTQILFRAKRLHV